jgi:hypothetical protein
MANGHIVRLENYESSFTPATYVSNPTIKIPLMICDDDNPPDFTTGSGIDWS